MYGRNRGYGQSGIPGLTPMVQKIIVANCFVFLAQQLGSRFGLNLTGFGAVSVYGVFHELRVWQPFTYMWLHGGLLHLVFNMLFLWMSGGQLESVWGSRRFLRFYLQCGIGAGFIILAWNALLSLWSPGMVLEPTLGASGAIYGVVAAFSLLWPDRTIMLLIPPMPIRAIYFVPFLLLLDFIFGGANVSIIGHLGGALIAAVILRRELRGVINWRSLRFRWHRLRMRSRLRAVRRDEWEKRRNDDHGVH